MLNISHQTIVVTVSHKTIIHLSCYYAFLLANKLNCTSILRPLSTHDDAMLTCQAFQSPSSPSWLHVTIHPVLIFISSRVPPTSQINSRCHRYWRALPKRWVVCGRSRPRVYVSMPVRVAGSTLRGGAQRMRVVPVRERSRMRRQTG